MSENAAALKIRIKALITLRASFVTLLLGSSFILKAGYEKFPHPQALSYLIISLYALTILYAILVERIKNLFVFAYSQLILDVVFGTVLIYITGGIESWFSFTLVLTIISSGIVLNKRAGYVMATLSSILYGTLINLQFHRLLSLSPGQFLVMKDYFYNIFVFVIGIDDLGYAFLVHNLCCQALVEICYGLPGGHYLYRDIITLVIDGYNFLGIA